LLDNESWSFYYTPDVRYGVEKLLCLSQIPNNLRTWGGDSGEENHSFRRHVDHARSEATLAAFMLA